MSAEEFRRLNLKIGRAEKDHDVTYLDGILHESLVFRRANGAIVGKREYLAGVPNRTYTLLQVTDLHDLDEKNDVAVWAMNVHAKGTTAEGVEFSGVFHNVRVLVRQDDRWQILAWANTKIGELDA